MNPSFLSRWTWRLVAWITALIFFALLLISAAQLYTTLAGGGA